MTKNTLAAALMVGVVGALAGIAYVIDNYPHDFGVFMIAVSIVGILFMVWFACQDFAGKIIEARRKRGEGPRV